MRRKTLIVHRPWGRFEQFTQNENTSVKVHHFKPDQLWSYQYHNHRDEFYKILAGNGTVIIDGKEYPAKPGDEFMVERGQKHRTRAGPEGLMLLEICFGAFDEKDEARLEGAYGRE